MMTINAEAGVPNRGEARRNLTPFRSNAESTAEIPRVVVTGFGAVSRWGWSATDLWQGLTSGTPGAEDPARFDTSGHRTRLACEARPMPTAWAQRLAGLRLSRADAFAVVAALDATTQAGWDDRIDPLDLGCFFGGSTAAMAEGERFFHHLRAGRPGRGGMGMLASHPLNGPGDAVARLVGARGPTQSLSSACAAGGLAIGAALDALREGEISVAVTGGADALCQLTYAGFNSLRIVDPQPCTPFRARRQGINLGEGAGVLVLETLDHARARGVSPFAEVLGVGASCDAHHMTAPHPTGAGAAAALEHALADAGIKPDAVGLINAHGTGTVQSDAAEWQAIERVLGTRAGSVPTVATKASVGHLLGSSGAVEAVATVQCLDAGQAHVSAGDGPIDEALGVDLVVQSPRSLASDTVAVSTSLGFGGANVVVVFRGWPKETRP